MALNRYFYTLQLFTKHDHKRQTNKTHYPPGFLTHHLPNEYE